MALFVALCVEHVRFVSDLSYVRLHEPVEPDIIVRRVQLGVGDANDVELQAVDAVCNHVREGDDDKAYAKYNGACNQRPY